MWQYDYSYMSHGLFGWTKKVHKYIDKFKNKVGDWVYVYKNKAKKAVKSIPKKIETGLNKAYNKAVEISTNIRENNPWVIDSGNYNKKVERVKQTKEWQDIVKRKDPEYVKNNGNGNYTYDIDAYITNKKHPVLDVIDDVMNGRDISINDITIDTIIAGADDYIQAGIAYVGLASIAAREGIKYRQGSYKDQEADIQEAIKSGAKFVNDLSKVYEENGDALNDILNTYSKNEANIERAKKYAQTIVTYADNNDVSIDDILARENVQEYLDEHGITEAQIKKYV